MIRDHSGINFGSINLGSVWGDGEYHSVRRMVMPRGTDMATRPGPRNTSLLVLSWRGVKWGSDAGFSSGNQENLF